MMTNCAALAANPATVALQTWRAGTPSSDICAADQAVGGSASGTLRSYCETFPASAYQSAAFQNIWRFDMALDNGATRAAYCLEKGLPGPLGSGHRYEGVPLPEAFPELTPSQLRQLAWLLQHTYQSVTPAALFAAAGVDATAAPPLDENDAYAAGQVALWSIFRPTAPAERAFYRCGTQTPHPKSSRLARTVTYLLEQSATAANAPLRRLAALPCGREGCRAASVPDLACLEDCGQQALTPLNGRWLYGPLRITARRAYTLTLYAACEHEAPTTPVLLATADGSPLMAPSDGSDFYLSFPSTVRANCYTLALRIEQREPCALAMRDDSNPPRPNRLQTMGLIIIDQDPAGEACLCFCCFAPANCPDCPACPACPACPDCPEPPVCPECPVCPDCPPGEECPKPPVCPKPPKPPCPPPKPLCPLTPPPCPPLPACHEPRQPLCYGGLGLCLKPPRRGKARPPVRW